VVPNVIVLFLIILYAQEIVCSCELKYISCLFAEASPNKPILQQCPTKAREVLPSDGP
jgi:hypothetical protein